MVDYRRSQFGGVLVAGMGFAALGAASPNRIVRSAGSS
jgi:hypothetical protein